MWRIATASPPTEIIIEMTKITEGHRRVNISVFGSVIAQPASNIPEIMSTTQDTMPVTITDPDPRKIRRLRSEEHTSELQSRGHLVCRLLLAKKKTSTVELT